MLGKYRLDRVLGAGGMGIVWAAFDPDLERAVAIKLLRSGDDEPVLRSRLLREARAMARLKHPNVLTVYEVGTFQNRDYIAMEQVDGDSLDVWLASRPPREQVTEALIAAGRGLAAAHAAGLVHRDFKPHNVLRSRDGHVYVTDFGLARGLIEEGPEVEQIAVTALPDDLATGSQLSRRPLDSVLDSPLTQTGVLIGTPAYMAPEQFIGRAPDARSDQFAFCVTAWEALTGARPFRGSNLAELQAAAASGPGGAAGDLPPALRAVLARGLEPNPGARWPDVPTLLRAFEESLASLTSQPAPRPRRRWRLAAAGGAAGCIVAAGLLFAVTGSSKDDPNKCGPPEEVFGTAWSASRRADVVKAHPGPETAAALGILDQVRTEWLTSYRRTCSEPPSESRRSHLACLIDTRNRVERTSAGLTVPGGSMAIGAIGALAASVSMCSVPRIRDVDWLRGLPEWLEQLDARDTGDEGDHAGDADEGDAAADEDEKAEDGDDLDPDVDVDVDMDTDGADRAGKRGPGPADRRHRPPARHPGRLPLRGPAHPEPPTPPAPPRP
jgi:eukaryotic-like serine/threonine-protein kinase